jgi:hypothetical protein
MPYKLSRWALKTTLVTYLSKNPRLEELLELALEGRSADLAQMISRYNSRPDYLKLAALKTADEVDAALTDLIRAELERIYDLLPSPYARYFRAFLPLYDFEKMLSAFSRGDLSEVRTGFLRREDLSTYGRCVKEGTYSCLIESFLENIRKCFETNISREYFAAAEDCSDSLRCLILAVTAGYTKYFLNTAKLGIERGEDPKEFIGRVLRGFREISGYGYELEKVVNHLTHVSRSEPYRVTLLEASYVYGKCKDYLLYSPQVVDLLTLYLVSRYYELHVLRYTLPQSWVIR